MAKDEGSQGSLSDTTINFFGPAYDAQKGDGLLSLLQNREAMNDLQQRVGAVLKLQNHKADPVGTVIGRNPGTGGTIPDGSSSEKEMVRAATGQPTTAHNCYGTPANSECGKFWNDSPNNRATFQPITSE